MRHIAEVNGQELAWTQRSYCQGEYELRAGDDAVATLRWRGGSLAVAETSDGRWSFERPGYRRSWVSVRTAGTGTEIAVFSSYRTGSGTLELAGDDTSIGPRPTSGARDGSGERSTVRNS